jgi:hypothetical protein
MEKLTGKENLSIFPRPSPEMDVMRLDHLDVMRLDHLLLQFNYYHRKK